MNVPLLLRWTDPASGRPRVRRLSGLVPIGAVAAAGGVALRDPSVAARHAEVDARDEACPRVRLVTAGAGLFVNGRLREEALLAPGDEVSIGSVLLRVEAAGGPGRRPEAGTPWTATGALTAVSLVAVVAIGSSLSLARRSVRAARPASRPLPVAAAAPAPTARPVPSPAAPEPMPAPALVPLPVPSQVPSATPARAPAPTAPAATVGLARGLEVTIGLTGRLYNGLGVVGSGVLVSDRGYALTNAHVLSGADALTARLHDGRRIPAHPVAADPDLDLALLRLFDDRPIPAVALGASEGLVVGQTVFAIGSPFGEELSFSVTRGIVSAPRRTVRGRVFVQHDAALNPGNSGGPLVDEAGRLLGINTWKVTEAQGLGFAIPVEEAVRFLRAQGVVR